MDTAPSPTPKAAVLEERAHRATARATELARLMTATRARRTLVSRRIRITQLQRQATLDGTRTAALVRRRERAGLTPRQHEILLLVSEGLSTKQIARELWLSPATVRNHVAAIMIALGTHSRLEAVSNARRAGLLGPPRAGAVQRLP
jgi:DNA-binding NarL/FixJ family response regulator